MITDRVVTIYGTIDAAVEQRVMDSLTKVAREPRTNLTVLLNSPGGSLYSGIRIRQAIADLPIQTEGIVFRKANSSCFSILQHCTWRTALPDAELMFHAPTMNGWRIDMPDYEKTFKTLRELFEIELLHLSDRSGQPVDKWREWAQTEHRFTAEEAFSLGILDAIYYRVPHL